MYLQTQCYLITVLYSPEALIHCIKVLSSIYNCYILNIITYIICFSTYLKIVGPRVGPGLALTRPDPGGPGPGPAKISRPWPGPAPGQCIGNLHLMFRATRVVWIYHHHPIVQNKRWKGVFRAFTYTLPSASHFKGCGPHFRGMCLQCEMEGIYTHRPSLVPRICFFMLHKLISYIF